MDFILLTHLCEYAACYWGAFWGGIRHPCYILAPPLNVCELHIIFVGTYYPPLALLGYIASIPCARLPVLCASSVCLHSHHVLSLHSACTHSSTMYARTYIRTVHVKYCERGILCYSTHIRITCTASLHHPPFLVCRYCIFFTTYIHTRTLCIPTAVSEPTWLS